MTQILLHTPYHIPLCFSTVLVHGPNSKPAVMDLIHKVSKHSGFTLEEVLYYLHTDVKNIHTDVENSEKYMQMLYELYKADKKKIIDVKDSLFTEFMV